jgi:TonB family protein
MELIDKVRLVAFLAGAASVGAAHGAPPARLVQDVDRQPDSAVPVMRALNAAMGNLLARQQDEFAQQRPIALSPGQKFEVIIASEDGVRTSCSHSYDGSRLRLVCIVRDAFQASGGAADGLVFLGTRVPWRPYIGENGFGVRRRVTVESWLHFAVQARSRPKAEADPDTGSADSAYVLDVAAEPEHARRLASSIALVVDGRVASDNGVASLDCNVDHQEPTLDAPSDVHDYTCSVDAEIDRVAFVDRTTGETLKAWDVASVAPTAPARPPAWPTPADWIRAPNGDDFARYYPDRAERMSVAGQVTLHCSVAISGTLDCSVTSEQPPDQDFGSAALKMSKLYKAQPSASGSQGDLTMTFTPPRS